MPSSIHRCSVRSHVPVAVLLTSPLAGSTAYSGALPSSHSQISVSVTQPPLVVPSPDSTYKRSDPEEYRNDTAAVESHSGLAMASFGEAVSMASPRLAARRLMTTAIRSIAIITICATPPVGCCWLCAVWEVWTAAWSFAIGEASGEWSGWLWGVGRWATGIPLCTALVKIESRSVFSTGHCRFNHR